jgi:hypothetical protein
MPDLPNPTQEQVTLWLKNGLTRDVLHHTGWQEVNQRFHGIARAARPYIQANYKTPEEQEAAFDGLTLALFTLGHFEDIKKLIATWDSQMSIESSAARTT